MEAGGWRRGVVNWTFLQNLDQEWLSMSPQKQVRVAVWRNIWYKKWYTYYKLTFQSILRSILQNFVFFAIFFFHLFFSRLQPWSAARAVFSTLPQSFVMFSFTMLGSKIDLYSWNRMPDYFTSARGAYKSLACRNFCIITLLLLLLPDTGQHRSSARVLNSQWKRRQ